MTIMQQYNMSARSKQAGFTLVELMIAMAISLAVLLAVGTVYFSTKRSYKVQTQYSQMQQGALYVFQQLSQNISNAGFAGCNPIINNHLATTNANVDFYNFADGVYGWEYTGTGPGSNYTITTLSPPGSAGNWSDNNGVGLDPTLTPYVIPGNDVLVIKSSEETPNLQLSADVVPSVPSLSFANPTLMTTGAIMLISDCAQADIFMNSDGPGANTLGSAGSCSGFLPCNTGAGWSHAYKKDEARIYHSTSKAYFIGKGVDGGPALFRYSFENGGASKPEELVDGVENMQILYGVKPSDNSLPDTANRYLTIDQINTANNVSLSDIISVRISLLMRTPGEVNRPTAKATVVVGSSSATGVTVTTLADKRMRQAFTTTITLRNMLARSRCWQPVGGSTCAQP